MWIHKRGIAVLAALMLAATAGMVLGALPQQAAAQPQESTAAPAPTPVSEKETVENPYGPAAIWSAKSLKDGVTGLKDGSAFRYLAESGINASEHHEGALLEQIDLNAWVTMSVQRAMENIQNRLQDGLAFLATVGSTAPFVGLFGTVWGIYHALTAIGIAGQASIDKVAGPVGEALIMTAVGLAVAVPAVLGYNWLVRRNKVAMEGVRTFGADLHSVLMGASSKSFAKSAAR